MFPETFKWGQIHKFTQGHMVVCCCNFCEHFREWGRKLVNGTICRVNKTKTSPDPWTFVSVSCQISISSGRCLIPRIRSAHLAGFGQALIGGSHGSLQQYGNTANTFFSNVLHKYTVNTTLQKCRHLHYTSPFTLINGVSLRGHVQTRQHSPLMALFTRDRRARFRFLIKTGHLLRWCGFSHGPWKRSQTQK